MTSPFSSSARIAISRAIVPLHIATQCFTPRYSAILPSNSCSTGPLLLSQRRSSICPTRCKKSSRSPTLGRPTWMGASKGNEESMLPVCLSGAELFFVMGLANWVIGVEPLFQAGTAILSVRLFDVTMRYCRCIFHHFRIDSGFHDRRLRLWVNPAYSCKNRALNHLRGLNKCHCRSRSFEPPGVLS